VVIPTRNRWDLLVRHGLPSAFGQEDVDIEVIVIDDGSTDGTTNRLQNLGDARLHVCRLDASRGVARARNTGIAEARGDWIAFLDDDDLWSPRKLRTQLERALVADASFVYASVVSVNEDGRVREVEAAPDAQQIDALLLRRNVLSAGSSTVLARTELVRRLGGFDPRLDELADWDLWLRLASVAKAASCPEVLVAYVIHPQNWRVVEDTDVEAEFEYLAQKHAPERRLDRQHFSRWVAMGHLRRGQTLRAVRTYLKAGIEHRSGGSLVRAAAALFGEAPFRAYRGILRARPEPDWLGLYPTLQPKSRPSRLRA
jgi:glycosyltransferase involved in cell wall biosynthesis